MKGIYGFLTSKKVEIIEKFDMREHDFNFEWQFHPSDLFQAQNLIIFQEIIGNRYLKYILVRILLKQLDYSLSISRGKSWFGLRSHQLSPHRNLELII